MSEFRQDKLRKSWVIVAEERAARPNAWEASGGTARFSSSGRCPFCGGNEVDTPVATATFPPAPEPWRVRVTPNKYPAVHDAIAARNGDGDETNGALFVRRTGLGQHEVIIESPDHLERASQLSVDDTVLVWGAYQDRLNAVEAAGRLPYARVFQNCGPAAGASIEHLHSQMIALPFLPNDASLEVLRLRDWRLEHGDSGLSQLVADERNNGDRVLLERDGLVAFCPYASRVPYEVWVTPTDRLPRFEATDPEVAAQAGQMVCELIARMDQSLHFPDYNYLIQTAPFDRSAEENYHWRIELFPRLTIAAGFEISSGCFINPVSPESAAKLLRNVETKSLDP